MSPVLRYVYRRYLLSYRYRCLDWYTRFIDLVLLAVKGSPKDNASFHACLQVLYTPMPCIHMLPARLTEFRAYSHYLCPLYKIPSRRGVLSTTGHSTNFVMDIRIPSNISQSHWIKRGVALMMSLSE